MGHLKPFWDDEYKHLNYRKEIFNDKYFIEKVKKMDTIIVLKSFRLTKCQTFMIMQPKWNDKIIDCNQ